MIESYPLSWPLGWKRTAPAARKRALFNAGSVEYSADRSASWNRKRDVTVAEGCDRVLAEVGRMGCPGYNTIVSTNVPVTRSGLPRSGLREPDDPGVAVYWRDGERRLVMAIDRYDRVADNLAAVAATLYAMRAIERHGGGAVLERAFTGFTALPAPGGTVARSWVEVLGYAPGSILTPREVEAAWKRLRSQHHPDKGGDPALFDEARRAYEQALQSLGVMA